MTTPFRLSSAFLPRFGAASQGTPSTDAAAAHHPPRAIARRLGVERSAFGDLTVFTLTPPEPLVPRVADGGPLLYLHGPLDAADAHPIHWSFLARVAERTGRAVTVPLYPSTPVDHRADDFLTLLRLFDELAAGTTDQAPIAVMGDAAGAQTARALVESAAAPGSPVAQLILLTADEAHGHSGVDEPVRESAVDVAPATHHAHEALFQSRRFVPESRQAIDQLVETLGPVKSLF